MQVNKLRGRGLLAAGLIAGAGLALAALPAAAAGPPSPALVSVYEAGIDFLPAAGYRQAILEVSGPEIELRQVFGAGQKPAIGRFGPQGQALPDGTYTWRLSLVPDAAAARALRDSAGKDRGEAPGAWQAQSASFTVRAVSCGLQMMVIPFCCARFARSGSAV